jgi:hypothetical protein
MLLLRGLIPRVLRAEHYAGAAFFGLFTSYYTMMPYFAEQARLREAAEAAGGAAPPPTAKHPGLLPRFGAPSKELAAVQGGTGQPAVDSASEGK